MGEVSETCKDEIIKALETNLDTRDKRFMFLKLEFRDLVSRINLEGSSHETAWNIFVEFKKQNMLGSLTACLNNAFECKILFEPY